MTAAGLGYDVLVSGLEPISDVASPLGSAARWSPLAHALVTGPRSSLVVDPPVTTAQTVALGDWIAERARRLDLVYVTHWHADHWLGAAALQHRFPGARVVAAPVTAARVREAATNGSLAAIWRPLFGDGLATVPPSFTVDPVGQGGLELDGHPIVPIEVGHGDTDDSTVLHVPELGLVAGGDVVYNNVHQHLGESLHGGLDGWHSALDIVASLRPRTVVAGHKDVRRPDSPEDVDETRRYLDLAGPLLESRPTRREYFRRTLDLFPDRLGPYTIWLTARVAGLED